VGGARWCSRVALPERPEASGRGRTPSEPNNTGGYLMEAGIVTRAVVVTTRRRLVAALPLANVLRHRRIPTRPSANVPANAASAIFLPMAHFPVVDTRDGLARLYYRTHSFNYHTRLLISGHLYQLALATDLAPLSQTPGHPGGSRFPSGIRCHCTQCHHPQLWLCWCDASTTSGPSGIAQRGQPVAAPVQWRRSMAGPSPRSPDTSTPSPASTGTPSLRDIVGL